MSSSFAPMPLQPTLLSESSTNHLRTLPPPSFKENNSSAPSSSKPGQSSTATHLRNVRRTRTRGTSSVSTITGNTPLRAAQQAAIRHTSRRSQSPPPSFRSGLETFSSRLQSHSSTSSSATAVPAATAPSATTTYRLPTILPRPKGMPMVTSAALKALDPTLETVPLPYIKDVLMARRDLMLRGLGSVDTKAAVLPPTGMPTSISLATSQQFSPTTMQLPSHLLCVVNEKTSRGQMFPVHALVMVAHCARIPAFPPPASATPNEATGAIDFPVVSISLPHADSFPLLFDYMYTKNFARFIGALLPLPSTSLPPLDEKLSADQRLASVIEALSQTYTMGALLEKLRFVHGTWANVCKLGIAEEGVWRVMNTAWTALVKALLRAQQESKNAS